MSHDPSTCPPHTFFSHLRFRHNHRCALMACSFRRHGAHPACVAPTRSPLSNSTLTPKHPNKCRCAPTACFFQTSPSAPSPRRRQRRPRRSSWWRSPSAARRWGLRAGRALRRLLMSWRSCGRSCRASSTWLQPAASPGKAASGGALRRLLSWLQWQMQSSRSGCACSLTAEQKEAAAFSLIMGAAAAACCGGARRSRQLLCGARCNRNAATGASAVGAGTCGTAVGSGGARGGGSSAQHSTAASQTLVKRTRAAPVEQRRVPDQAGH